MVDKLIGADSAEFLFVVVAACIDSVFDETGVYKSEVATVEEMLKFVETLPSDKFDLLAEFVDKLPKSRYETTKVCPKCHYEHKFVLEGLSDFFT